MIPVILFAENSEIEYDFKNFESPIKLTRGVINPISKIGLYLEKNEACKLVIKEWGWVKENCNRLDALLVLVKENIDTVIIEKPNDIGYVEYSDWESKNKEKHIQEIWDLLQKTYNEQAKRLDSIKTWRLKEWLVYPTLNKEKNYLYYVTSAEINGENLITINATLFDRYGNVKFQIIPRDHESTESDFKTIIKDTFSIYKSNIGTSYADYKIGDKISEYGVLGVLATLAGVKWGKAIAGGLVATLLVFAKKFWFVLFLPFLFLGKLFNRKRK